MELARRIEALEAAGGVVAARSMQSLGGASAPHLGGQAIFGGVDSPMTHALGIGMRGPATEPEFEAMERFFIERESPVLIDLCPLAHESVQQMVRERGYRIIEFNNVMVLRITGDLPLPAGIEVRPIERGEEIRNPVTRIRRCVSRGLTKDQREDGLPSLERLNLMGWMAVPNLLSQVHRRGAIHNADHDDWPRFGKACLSGPWR